MDMYQKRKMRKEKNIQKSYEQDLNSKTNINYFPGHMAKAISEIKKDISFVDVVCIVLDARVPFASCNLDILSLTKKENSIIVFNKEDLADMEKLNLAVNKYNIEGYNTICIDSKNKEGIKQLITKIIGIGSKFKNKNKTNEIYSKMKPVYKVMIVGVPNVGKSSLINALINKNSAEVGNKPGVTKSKQWLKVGNNVELLDTAGVLWPSLSSNDAGIKLALIGSIKDEVVDKVAICYEFLKYIKLDNKYYNMLLERYKIENKMTFTDEELLSEIGKKRGALLSGGCIDLEKTASIILEDFRSGKIGKINLE